MANQTSITYSGTQQGGGKVTTTVSYVNPDATDNQLIGLATQINALTTNQLDEVNKVTKKMLIGTTPRNFTLSQSTFTAAEISSTGDGPTEITMTFAGEPTELPSVSFKTGDISDYIYAEVFIFTNGSTSEKTIALIKSGTDIAGTEITLSLPQTETYDAATAKITITE